MTDTAAPTPAKPTFFGSLGRIYAASFGLALAAPLFFLIPVIAEFAQHVAEHRTGMYDSLEAAQRLEHHPVRMGFGYVKTFALTLAWLWVPLYLAAGRRRFGPISRGSFSGFAKVLAFSLAVTAIIIATGIVMREQGADTNTILAVTVAVLVVTMILEVLVAPWKAAAVIGDRRVSLARSIGLAAPILPWGLALALLAMLPMMAVHYALGAMMLFSENQTLFWGLAVADSVVVGILATPVVAPAYYIYRRALIRRDETPDGAP